MKDITCIEDLRLIHKRRVPKAFFDYVDRGSYAEETLRANRSDMERLKFRQRILVDIAKRELDTTILGEQASMPLILAPVGSTGMQYADGEIHACRAAQAAGIPYTLSTMSICSIEDVAAHVEKPFWFQLYVMKDRGFVKALIERAIAAKCSALVLTVDLQVIGQRHADIKNGLTVPPQLLKLKNIIDFATKPGWVSGMARTKRRNFGNIAGHLPGAQDLASVSGWVASQFDPSLNWKDIEWIRSIWPGKLVIKGILDVADAREAVKTGAEALVVSNHGGRQLDGAPSSISVLPDIVQDVGSQIEVLFDGGIRSGQDLMRALALGAKSCMIGRAYIYGLGAGGQEGVATALDVIGKELSVTMGLCGVNRIADIDRRVLTDYLQTNAISSPRS
ncbi:alpha-hydroxy-acid oxidizing enzyme [Afipia sp. Root123D2]|uniref:alpha-hydroxy acid oxidase n=1 Tax=Afipia sp. Root123D2 TaxID=1736436 RepID=UPI0006FABAAC|nr:alpha-hydroxy acid oxidase [Afipia sp. Root123D2]KQW21521.1 alpha-hydroxy-acid oxidizing enzyme [Afipia sp. Root123D2]